MHALLPNELLEVWEQGNNLPASRCALLLLALREQTFDAEEESLAFHESLATISAKPGGVGAASQQWIPTGEQSLLLTRIATTESVSLCMSMKS
jgi:hypothetical protein